MKKGFLPKSDTDRALWLQNFSAKLPSYAGKYNIKETEITDLQQASVLFSYILDCKKKFDNHVKELMRYKNDLAKGVSTRFNEPVPILPAFDPTPALVPKGVFRRVTAIGMAIKDNIAYIEADGLNLGLEEPEVIPDMENLKPAIRVRLITGGQPEIVWRKQNMHAIEIHKEDEHGNWQFLVIDTKPNYTDISPLPPKGRSEEWKYRAIYRYNDVPAGQWSNMVSIAVGEEE